MLFHMIFSTGDDTLTTLNLRSIESIFFFHPDARLRIHTRENNSSGLSSRRTLDTYLQPLLDEGYDITLVRYTRPEVWLQAVLDVADSAIDLQAAADFISHLPKLSQEKYWYSNETNLLRLCVLYLHGGIYLDTDVIWISPILANNHQIDNAMGRNQNKFHCAVMKFTQPRNRFLAATLTNFLLHYNGTKWGHNGPVAYGRTAQEHPELVCPEDRRDYFGTTTSSHPPEHGEEFPSVKAKGCALNPLPNEAFAPVSWKIWDQVCFSDEDALPEYNDAKALITRSFAVHLNNRKTGSKLQNMEYRKGSLCDYVLNSFCNLCLTIT